ncbi:hypothetical protein [Burkholderia pyrrocinia]|uniref:hypothetical protein n=1 Tax=Burkholderia pyrrocinia TaxID=60550 RepID=UPI001BCB8A26|nr:hypothetical protein [Burkholderia pyrrocinia]QVN20739.1 hypothetical protein JYG32_29750 [Burkholderia pyrrocinia]
MQKTPTASGCRQAPGIGTNGDITLKGLVSALPAHVERMHFMRIDFGDGFVLRSPNDVLEQVEAKRGRTGGKAGCLSHKRAIYRTLSTNVAHQKPLHIIFGRIDMRKAPAGGASMRCIEEGI